MTITCLGARNMYCGSSTWVPNPPGDVLNSFCAFPTIVAVLQQASLGSDFLGVLIPPFSWAAQAGLKMEFVYGCEGLDSTAPNLFWTAEGKLVYYVAALGIVYDPSNHTQKFFTVRPHKPSSINMGS